LFKVIYILLLLFGIYWSYTASLAAEPQTHITKRSIIHCHNGKKFYPDSKPIYPKGDEPDPPRYSDIRHRQISSECEYGTADYVGDGVPHPKNYIEAFEEKTSHEGSRIEQIQIFTVILIIYVLILELVRRISRYIFSGKSVFSIK
jgi:hypothetical protein